MVLDIMYYIYHISGVKIGCAEDVAVRTRKQNFTSYEILEEHTCIYEASKREIELQKEYGYKVDTIPYWKAVENRHKWNSQTAKAAGSIRPANTDNYREGGRIAMAKLAAKKITCEHCGKESNPGNHKQHHGDNCKLSPS